MATYVSMEPYYTSSIWTLHVDGKAYCLGEGPKFIQRVLGLDYRYDWTPFVRAEAKRMHKAIDNVFVGRLLLRLMGGRQALAQVENPWDLTSLPTYAIMCAWADRCEGVQRWVQQK